MNDNKPKTSFEPVKNDHESNPPGSHHGKSRENDLGKTLPLMVFYVGIVASILLFLFLGGNDGDDSSRRFVVSVQAAGQQTPTDTPTTAPTPTPTPTPPGETIDATTAAGLEAIFPNLDCAVARKTGDATNTYNCHRWAIHHDTNGNLNSQMDTNSDNMISYAEYDIYMIGEGWEECGQNDDPWIVMYMKGNEVKHSALKINWIYWESKLGPSIRMSHLPGVLDDSSPGAAYGTRKHWYRPMYP